MLESRAGEARIHRIDAIDGTSFSSSEDRGNESIARQFAEQWLATVHIFLTARDWVRSSDCFGRAGTFCWARKSGPDASQ